MNGMIVSFNERKGLGYIIADNKFYPFYRSSSTWGDLAFSPSAGDNVTFKVVHGALGPQAIELERT